MCQISSTLRLSLSLSLSALFLLDKGVSKERANHNSEPARVFSLPACQNLAQKRFIGATLRAVTALLACHLSLSLSLSGSACVRACVRVCDLPLPYVLSLSLSLSLSGWEWNSVSHKRGQRFCYCFRSTIWTAPRQRSRPGWPC